jgi:hypothetical protein
MLAEKTGWSENFILWELPLHRLYQYYHAALRAVDAWTVMPMPAPTGMANATLAAIAATIEADNEAMDDEGDY